MGILNSWQLSAPTLLVVLAIATLAAGDDLISQMIANPLNMGSGSAQLTNSQPPQGTDSPNFIFSTVNSPPPPPPGAASTPAPGYSTADMLAENALQFGHNMLQQLSYMDPYATRSEIFSPLSLMSALSLLMLGAKGKSYQELKAVLGLENIPEFNTNPGKFHQIFGSMIDDMQNFDVNTGRDANTRKRPNWFYTAAKKNVRETASNRKTEQINHTINVANGLFVQEGYTLNPDYRQVIDSIYDSHLAQLDYKTKSREATKYINKWSNDNTNGKIPELISRNIPSVTNIILASTLYFRGFWQTPFFQRSTKEDNFYQDGPNTKPIRVQLMATGGIFPFYDAKEYDCRILGLPYKGNETTMYVIQPNDSTRLKLRGLMSVLDARKINDMIDKMMLKTTVMVFPKMHFARTMTLNDILPAMGVTDVFNPGLSDLSLIGGRNMANNGRRPIFSPVPTPVAQTPTVPARKGLAAVNQQYYDRYNEKPLIFLSRFGEEEEEQGNSTTATTEMPAMQTIEDTTPAHAIEKRQAPNDANLQALSNLEAERFTYNGYHSDLFVNEIIHKVDFAVDEQGTEAAAATAAYLYRSGTDVVFRGDTPFLILIRHDHSKLPLFYGVINKPEL